MIDGQNPHAPGLVVTVTLLVTDALLRISGCFVMTLLDVDFCHDTFGARCERRVAEGANADITFGTYNAEGLEMPSQRQLAVPIK